MLETARIDLIMSYMSRSNDLMNLMKTGDVSAYLTREDRAKGLDVSELLNWVEEVAQNADWIQLSAGRSHGESFHEKRERLIEQMLPEFDVPSEASVVLARRSSVERARLFEEFGGLTSDQISEVNSRAHNRSSLPSRWRDEKRIFAVNYRGQRLHPGFQFDENLAPLSIIERILKTLPTSEMSEWEVAFWFVAANSYLDGRRPVDSLVDKPHDVVEAAAQECNELPL